MTQPAIQPQQEQPQIEPVFVARQPIFDRAERLWGYELLFRHSAEAPSAAFSESSVATSKMVADGFILAQAGLPPACMLFINFPEALLLEGAAYALPKEQCVVEILEDVPPTSAILTACGKLKEAGYVLALDDYFGETAMEPFLALADIIKVDLRGKGRAEIEPLTRRLSREGRKLLAEKVEDAETHALVKGLGYALFQGFYFSRPETLSGRKVSGAAASRVKLLSELSKEDYETAALSKIISSDAALSYRLLQFINSAYFSRPFKISSIGQAIAALGQRPLRHWLMAVILSDLSPTPKAKEICANSVQRARLLETLAEQSRRSPRPPDSMFLLGLLSRLDALLGMEMARIIAGMPLDDEIADALLGKPNPPRSWLDMAASLEAGDWVTAEDLFSRLGLEGADTARRQAEAQVWTFQTLTSASASA